jgi:hypothetical protein
LLLKFDWDTLAVKRFFVIMNLSERYGAEVMGFVEALALAMAADDAVKDEEVAKAEEAIKAICFAPFELSESDRSLLAQFTVARAQEMVAASFAAIGGASEYVERLVALLALNLQAIAQASSQRAAIISVAQDIVGIDGEITGKESSTLACLDICLTEGPAAAFRSLIETADNS